MRFIPAQLCTFVEIGHEIFHGHSTPLSDSRRTVDSYKRKYKHGMLLIGLV